MPRPRADRTARRAELASVAAAVFAERGVANTAVSDIVKAASVAQGTFYLYFDSKDDALLAVAELMVDRMLVGIEAAVSATEATSVEKLLGLQAALTRVDSSPAAIELTALLHHPDNRALHDRLAEHLIPRLLPLVESIVSQGVSEGTFDVPDTRAAAWFVLGGLQSAELSGTPAAQMPAAIAAATQLALRALGYREATA